MSLSPSLSPWVLILWPQFWSLNHHFDPFIGLVCHDECVDSPGASTACDESASSSCDESAGGFAGAAHGIAVGERIDAVRNSGDGFFTRFQPVSICKHGEFKGFHKIIRILIGIIEFDAGIVTMGFDPSKKKWAMPIKVWNGWVNTPIHVPKKEVQRAVWVHVLRKAMPFCNIPWHRLENFPYMWKVPPLALRRLFTVLIGSWYYQECGGIKWGFNHRMDIHK